MKIGTKHWWICEVENLRNEEIASICMDLYRELGCSVEVDGSTIMVGDRRFTLESGMLLIINRETKELYFMPVETG